MVLLAAFLGWMFDGLEMGIFPLIARPALQQMQTSHGILDDKFVGHWMGWVTASFLLGAAGLLERLLEERRVGQGLALDRREPEPAALILKTIGLGAAAAVPAVSGAFSQ